MNLKQKMELRRKVLALKEEKNQLAMIKRMAKKDGGGKHSNSAWLLDKIFGAGDYAVSDYGEPQERSEHYQD